MLYAVFSMVCALWYALYGMRSMVLVCALVLRSMLCACALWYMLSALSLWYMFYGMHSMPSATVLQ